MLRQSSREGARMLPVYPGICLDGAKSLEIPQKEGVLGSEIAGAHMLPVLASPQPPHQCFPDPVVADTQPANAVEETLPEDQEKTWSHIGEAQDNTDREHELGQIPACRCWR